MSSLSFKVVLRYFNRKNPMSGHRFGKKNQAIYIGQIMDCA